uniref:Putative ovule protein n=1 Tax=Solanum chacoense TaxID=4108 RepID=A0A0V0GUK6_SOLCH
MVMSTRPVGLCLPRRLKRSMYSYRDQRNTIETFIRSKNRRIYCGNMLARALLTFVRSWIAWS